MKKTPLLLAALILAQNVKAPEPERPKMSFAEGVCAGCFLGCFCGLAIYVVYRCASNIHIPPPETNAPPIWDGPPPPPEPTNAPPTNVTSKVVVLEAGNTTWGQPLGPGRMGYVIRLEGSDDLTNWNAIGTLQGMTGPQGEHWRLWSQDWQLLSSGGTNLTAPFTNHFYRSKL